MKIAIDLDGVIWNLMTVFLEIYNEIYNENIKYEDVQDWHFFPDKRFFETYQLANERLFEYPVIEENIDKHLYKLNVTDCHDVQILTHEINTIENLKSKLLIHNIIEGVHYNKLIKDHNSIKKVDYNFDVFVDDAPFMTEDIKRFPEKTLILYDQPWNWKATNGSVNVHRVYNRKEVMREIRKLKKR